MTEKVDFLDYHYFMTHSRNKQLLNKTVINRNLEIKLTIVSFVLSTISYTENNDKILQTKSQRLN